MSESHMQRQRQSVVCLVKRENSTRIIHCVCAISNCFPNAIVLYFLNMNQVNHAS